MMQKTITGKPEWLKIRPRISDRYKGIRASLGQIGLVTVCEEAHCPNISECWSGGTATFMIMGDTCTRECKFCAVKTAFPAQPLDPEEPAKLAEAIKRWNLGYVVITSVDRDDLKDYGSAHFAKCIKEIRKKLPKVFIETLIPDFKGNRDCIKTVVDARPDVIGHNVETVRSLQRAVRDPRANYEQSLSVLKTVKELNPEIYTKSSIILGLGETDEEVIKTMRDLRKIDVGLLTLGQYLRPGKWNYEVKEYVHPDKFKYFKKKGHEMGFLYVASGPFVRSSYKAGELFMKNVLGKK